MAERTIVGVDFSGGGDDAATGNTWVTKGCFGGNVLTIDKCYPIGRTELKQLLLELPNDAVAALDFPFGVAQKLFPSFTPGKSTMKDVWNEISKQTDAKEFDVFCSHHRAVKRRFDYRYYPTSKSPQDPMMTYMTYHGIKMLRDLHDECAERWYVPSLLPDEPCKGRVTLLEVMPGMTLLARGLPHQNYKNHAGPITLTNFENRMDIIRELPERYGVRLPDLNKYRDLFIFSPDALDSYIASITAALWAQEKANFHRPEDHQDQDLRNSVRLEGCIFAPGKLASSV